MDPSFAESMGINIDNVLISPPDSAENMLSMVNTLTKSGSIDVIVVDSVCNYLLFNVHMHSTLTNTLLIQTLMLSFSLVI